MWTCAYIHPRTVFSLGKQPMTSTFALWALDLDQAILSFCISYIVTNYLTLCHFQSFSRSLFFCCHPQIAEQSCWEETPSVLSINLPLCLHSANQHLNNQELQAIIAGYSFSYAVHMLKHSNSFSITSRTLICKININVCMYYLNANKCEIYYLSSYCLGSNTLRSVWVGFVCEVITV